MLHVGDITKLDGAKLPPVDVICGGSPCQDYAEEKVIPKFKPPPL
jgi:DNA (cytosine-5)-methyltransferase 1